MRMHPQWVDHDGAGRPFLHPVFEDRTAAAVVALTCNPQVIGELAYTDEETIAIGQALMKDDAAALLATYRAAMDRHVQELIDGWQERSGNDSDYDAAIALGRIYA